MPNRVWTDEEWREAVERSRALIREAQEKAKTLSHEEFAKWWRSTVAVKGGGAYEALLEIREAMRGWDSMTPDRKRQKQTQTPQFVLNASVSLLWFLVDEPPDLRARARLLLDDIMSGLVTVHVPDIWLFEVSGGLVKAVHSKRLTITQAQAALSMVEALVALPNWHTHFHNRDWLYSDVARWAMGYSVSFYDAVYLFLALHQRATFWTADQRLYRFLVQTKRRLKLPVQWIGDYKVKW
jgi:predicted nucleic acid-binding protein